MTVRIEELQKQNTKTFDGSPSQQGKGAEKRAAGRQSAEQSEDVL